MTALVLKWRTLLRSFRGLSGASAQSGDFPMRWVVIGSLVATVLLVISLVVIVLFDLLQRRLVRRG